MGFGIPAGKDEYIKIPSLSFQVYRVGVNYYYLWFTGNRARRVIFTLGEGQGIVCVKLKRCR